MTQPTVLFVDDDQHLLDALRRRLRGEPYAIRLAVGPTDALRVLEEVPIDVVVSDEEMPVMRGTDLLAAIHARYPDTIGILLTGRASVDVAMRAINQGAVFRFFTKPCDPEDLGIAIRQGLLQRTLLLQSRRLLHAVRVQGAEIDGRDVAELMRVERDDSGAVVLHDTPIDLEALLAEMEKEGDAADQRMRRRLEEVTGDATASPARPSVPYAAGGSRGSS